MWLKYSDEIIMLGEHYSQPQAPPYSSFDKPRGFWITDDSEDCWRKWCESEKFRLECLSHKHEVVLDEANILILRSPCELDDFTERFGTYLKWEHSGEIQRSASIDWREVAQSYNGLIITPYHWERRMTHNWYYAWDCASGCVWNTEAIKEIKLL